VARVKDFPPGTVRTLQIEGTPIAVFNLNGHYYAIEDLCSHEAETLSDGEVAGEEIICPRHGAHFSIRTGAALSPPAYEPLATSRCGSRVEWSW
jgi:3-phenylpropionate/trans-cinnamate dioxygenase ferredoxin subunit